MKIQFKVLFIVLGIMFSVGFVHAKNNTSPQENKQTIASTKVTSTNIHVDDIVIKNLTDAQTHNLSISEDEHKRLVDKLSYDAEKEITNWITWKIFLGIIPLFLAIVAAIWSFISREIEKRIEKQIEKQIEKLEKQREKAIEVTIRANVEIEKTQKALEELQKIEDDLDKNIKDFEKKFSEEIKNKEKEIIEISNQANIIKNNLDSINSELESKVTDEIDLVRQKIKVIRLLIDKIDKDDFYKNEVIDDLISNLKSDDTEKKYESVELLSQFKSKKIADIFVEILKTKPDITFGSLLFNGLGEVDGDKENLKNYLVELTNDLSNPNILAIIGALGSFNDSEEIIESEVIKQLISILQSNLDDQDFPSDITASKIKSTIAIALSRYTDKSSNAIEDLVKLLKDSEYETRKNAATTLGAIGSKAKSAIPSLKRLENDEYIEVQKAALDAIENINHV